MTNAARSVLGALCALILLAPVGWAQNRYPDLVKMMRGSEPIFLIQMVTNKCWKLRLAGQTGSVLEFDIDAHDGKMKLDMANGDTQIPWRWKIEKRILSSADRVVNRCLPKEEMRNYAQGAMRVTGKGNPYIWVLQNKAAFCARMGLYTDCRRDCRKRVGPGTDVYGIVRGQYAAEKLSGARCDGGS